MEKYRHLGRDYYLAKGTVENRWSQHAIFLNKGTNTELKLFHKAHSYNSERVKRKIEQFPEKFLVKKLPSTDEKRLLIKLIRDCLSEERDHFWNVRRFLFHHLSRTNFDPWPLASAVEESFDRVDTDLELELFDHFGEDSFFRASVLGGMAVVWAIFVGYYSRHFLTQLYHAPLLHMTYFQDEENLYLQKKSPVSFDSSLSQKLEQLVELPSLIDSTRRIASKEKGTHFLEFDLIMRAFEKNFAGEVRSYNLIQWNNFKDDFFSSLFFNDSSKIGMVRAA